MDTNQDPRIEVVRDRLVIAMHRIRMSEKLHAMLYTQRVYCRMQLVLEILDDGHTYEEIMDCCRAENLFMPLEEYGAKYISR